MLGANLEYYIPTLLYINPTEAFDQTFLHYVWKTKVTVKLLWNLNHSHLPKVNFCAKNSAFASSECILDTHCISFHVWSCAKGFFAETSIFKDLSLVCDHMLSGKLET